MENNLFKVKTVDEYGAVNYTVSGTYAECQEKIRFMKEFMKNSPLETVGIKNGKRVLIPAPKQTYTIIPADSE